MRILGSEMLILEDMISGIYRPNKVKMNNHPATYCSDLVYKVKEAYDSALFAFQTYFHGLSFSYAFQYSSPQMQKRGGFVRNVVFYGDEEDKSTAHISGVLRHMNILAPAGWILKLIKIMLISTGKAANPDNILELYRSLSGKKSDDG